MASRTLESGTPLPLYFRLREALLDEIRDQGLRPGDRLPTEAEIERRYGVSRATIRRAMSDLEVDGMVRRVQGKGTFVAAPTIQHVPVLTSYSELLRRQGRVPSHRLLESSVAPASAELADSLGVEEGTSCRYLHRLFLADGEIVGVAETWLPRAVLGVHDQLLEADGLEDGSLYERLEQEPIGLVLDSATETISPRLAEQPEAQLLGCSVGSPLLRIIRTTYTPDEQPVEFTRLLFVGGRYEYRVRLHQPADRSR